MNRQEAEAYLKETDSAVILAHQNGEPIDADVKVQRQACRELIQLESDLEVAAFNAKVAQVYLKNTEWYVARELDNGVLIPEEVAAKREEYMRLLA